MRSPHPIQVVCDPGKDSSRRRTWWALTVALLLCAGPGLTPHPAQAAAKKAAERADAPAPKKKTTSKVTYQRSSSQETPAERDKRLYRECKGMNNAGACRGYTR